MKLAEALMERAANKKLLIELASRMEDYAVYEENTTPPHDFVETATRFEMLSNRQIALITAINLTNTLVMLPNGMTMTEALALREMMHYKSKVYANVFNETQNNSRGMFARRTKDEIRYVPSFDLPNATKQRDEIAVAIRKLEVDIQALNWTADLQGLE